MNNTRKENGLARGGAVIGKFGLLQFTNRALLGQMKKSPHGEQPPLTTCRASCSETHHSKLLSDKTEADLAFFAL